MHVHQLSAEGSVNQRMLELVRRGSCDELLVIADQPSGPVDQYRERVVKIGMTRRLEPADRIRELGDASVPFRYDTHALFFADDAVGIESKLHHRFSDRRVNRVNNSREFFYATPAEVKAALLELTGELLNYEDLAEALEYRQSQALPPQSQSLEDVSPSGAPAASGDATEMTIDQAVEPIAAGVRNP